MNKQTITAPFLAVIFLILNSLLITSASATTPSTGWITDFRHQPVSIMAQLTGQQDVDKQTVDALLHVKLEDDWKTYWRSPGEGGVAPSFDWSQSSNIAGVNWSWPAPKRYPVLGVETLGYKDQVNFPLTLQLIDIKQPAILKGTLTLASCTTICVLTDFAIDLEFDPNNLAIDENVFFDYSQAVGSIPLKIDEQQVKQQKNNATIEDVRSSWNQSSQQLVVQVTNQFSWSNPDVFIDSSDPELIDISYSPPTIEVDNNILTATFNASSWAGDVDLTGKIINATVIDSNVAVELTSTTSNQIIVSQGSDSIASMFIIALIGGLILNIMPCVLPVLGMKLSSVLSAQGIQRRQIRTQFLASSAGILTSFWLLAAFLAMLKFSGQALGWGIQFQNPYFIGTMVIITALFAANMMGLFEIQLPSKMQTWLATKGDQSHLGHYLQGMFATLLATPCSAPFLGTAVAFALGASMLELFVIFTALGLGMAMPWLLIALFPSIALLLPKPGKWMGTIKLIFALMILVTCFWLLSLLTNFIGLLAVLIIAALLLLIFSIMAVRKYGKRIFLIVFSSLLLVTALGLLVGSLTAKHWASPLASDLEWQALDAGSIEAQVAAGKTVFVDVTADWCVTCKANKIGVLLQDPVYSALQADNILLMKGDWTVRSDSVTAYLQSFNRYGVPFNIVYGPAAPQGLPLSTILSSDEVLSTIKQAQGEL
ncbi:MAG: protein-disulfide reductase DsbD domain-containing protein [Psychromonas sp.]